jgi:hypothetical protein
MITMMKCVSKLFHNRLPVNLSHVLFLLLCTISRVFFAVALFSYTLVSKLFKFCHAIIISFTSRVTGDPGNPSLRENNIVFINVNSPAAV